MLPIPPSLAWHYRLATDRDICSWSFGVLTAPRSDEAQGWSQRRGTLDDQAIFGPVRDYECACGKYSGRQCSAMICDICGTKVTVTAVRRKRFGHVRFPLPVPHPFGNALLTVFPILPAAFHSRGRSDVTPLYGELFDVINATTLRSHANPDEPSKNIAAALQRIIEEILPSATYAHESHLPEAEVFARGLALVPASSSPRRRCAYCGYPLEGLDVDICPGCGNRSR
jgi:hypothetical protein